MRTSGLGASAARLSVELNLSGRRGSFSVPIDDFAELVVLGEGRVGDAGAVESARCGGVDEGRSAEWSSEKSSYSAYLGMRWIAEGPKPSGESTMVATRADKSSILDRITLEPTLKFTFPPCPLPLARHFYSPSFPRSLARPTDSRP